MTLLEQIIDGSQKPATTKATYRKAVKYFLAHAGALPDRWTARAVESWRDTMLAAKLAPGTVNVRLRALRYASRRYNDLGHGDNFAGPAELVHDPNSSSSIRSALSFANAQALVEACRGPTPIDVRDNALVLVGLRTGLRREEIVSATMGKIEGNRLSVIQKGRRLHHAYLDQDAMVALGGWLAWLADHGVTTGRVFRSVRQRGLDDMYRIGASLSGSGFWRILDGRAKAAGIVHVHPHILRHTFISLALEGGETPERVAKAVGHKTLNQILRYMTDSRSATSPVGASVPRF